MKALPPVDRVFVQRKCIAIPGMVSLPMRSQQGAESQAHTEVKEAPGWRRGRGELFNGYRVHIFQNDKVQRFYFTTV